MSQKKFKVVVCRGPECGDKRSSRAVYDAFRAALQVRGLDEAVALEWQSCFGRCTQGPNTLIREVRESDERARRFVFATPGLGPRRQSALYNRLAPRDVGELIDEHIVGGRLVRRLIERPARSDAGEDVSQENPSRTDGDP